MTTKIRQNNTTATEEKMKFGKQVTWCSGSCADSIHEDWQELMRETQHSDHLGKKGISTPQNELFLPSY